VKPSAQPGPDRSAFLPPARSRWRRFLGTGLAAVALVLPVAAREPANLNALKDEIRAYIDSGEYERDIAVVAAQANAWLEQRARQGGVHLAVVIDVDETLLSNLPLMRRLDFGYVPDQWTAWVASGEAPVIAPVREIVRTARRLGLEVILLSGRRERDREGTVKNLRAVGCGDYTLLILKSDTAPEGTGAFKLAERRRLAAEGHVIIANVGDQDSDFAGGYAEKTFKLPDPFYLMK